MVEKKTTIMDDEDSYEDTYKKLALKTYENFKQNTETQYIKDHTIVENDSYQNTELYQFI